MKYYVLIASTILTTLILANTTIKPMIVISESMEPTIPTYSVFYVDLTYNYEDLEVGDIITYKHNEHGIIVHRVNTIYSNGYILTKGDNNQFIDNWLVTEDNYIGKVIGE